jgi:hypothetical protein
MRIDCRLTLSLYTPVSIDFSVYIGTARQRFRLDAMVIRTTASGAALMFDLEESQFLALHRALENSSDALLADRQRATHRAPPETIHALRRAS